MLGVDAWSAMPSMEERILARLPCTAEASKPPVAAAAATATAAPSPRVAPGVSHGTWRLIFLTGLLVGIAFGYLLRAPGPGEKIMSLVSKRLPPVFHVPQRPSRAVKRPSR